MRNRHKTLRVQYKRTDFIMRRLRALFFDFWEGAFIEKALSFLFFPLRAVSTALLAGLLFSYTRTKHGRIWITCVADTSAFTEVTFEALTLIKTFDPRHYALLQNELWFIDYVPSVRFGEYDPFFHRCKINFGALDFDWDNKNAPDYALHREWYIARCAVLFVHEATHGRLYRLGFPYTRRTRLRVERICNRMERRFAARLPQTTYNFATDLVPPFDPSHWSYRWNTPRWQQIKDSFRRTTKQIKERND